jgi:hypothetical protein
MSVRWRIDPVHLNPWLPAVCSLLDRGAGPHDQDHHDQQCAESIENVAGVSDAIGISDIAADSIQAVCVGHRRLDVFF